MSKSLSKNQSEPMLKWLNKNRHQVLELYKNQYIAYNSQGVIAHGKNLQEVLQTAEASGQHFLIYLVPSRRLSLQILPIHFRSVVRHD